jgi:hypothetical protein
MAKPPMLWPWHRLRPVMGVEFAVNIAQVSFDRVQRKVKPGSGLGIGQAFGDELKYLQFALAQEFNLLSGFPAQRYFLLRDSDPSPG